jgi:hypothetical protein
MYSEIIFEEIQSSAQRPMHIFFRLVVLLLLSATVVTLYYSGGVIEEQTLFYFAGASLFLIFLSLSSTRLITQVRTDGIYVRFPPFQTGFTCYTWDMIEEAYIRDYEPLTEYGGLGIRIGPSGNAFTVGGTTGLQLVLRDGQRMLITTHHPEELITSLEDVRWG